MTRDGGMALLQEESDDSDDDEEDSTDSTNDNDGGGAVEGGATDDANVTDIDKETAKRVLVLMEHARNCPGKHANPELRDVCQR